jgi:hypothetical protein
MTDTHIRPFAAFLQELNDGESHTELSQALPSLVEAVQAAGKAGTITYTLKVAPAGRGGATVMITDKIAVKSPEPARSETVWFIDAGGNVVRNNPAQPQLLLREVSRPKFTDAEKNGATGEIGDDSALAAGDVAR